MGVLQRFISILRGYVSATSDRVERIAAEEELRLARARKESLAELQSDSIAQRRPAVRRVGRSPRTSELSESLAADYRMLGLAPGCGLEKVESAWRSVAHRADPKRFPSGSDEEKRAGEILDSINSAYARIREHLNPTEGRFGNLEL